METLEQSPTGRSCRDGMGDHPPFATQKVITTEEGQWRVCERCSTAWFHTNVELAQFAKSQVTPPTAGEGGV
jgi:hypothetical protein